ncbi:MAG: CoA transferase [Gammaproteobacteria bacterium]|nr:CoA transferase [Gammaproteobacteria bacterium]
MDWLEGVQIAQAASRQVPEVALRAIDLAGQMARQLGADVFVDAHFSKASTFRSRGKLRLQTPVADWLNADAARLAVIATVDEKELIESSADQSQVVLHVDANASEATLFADSGLADLLGDPARAALIPRGDYAAGTVALAVLAAITSLVALRRRGGRADIAHIHARSVLSWVNWKAAVAGDLGRDLRREGARAEWPIIPCKDGHAALIYQERDWRNIVAMVGDARLAETRFGSFRGRAAHREEYMAIIRDWTAERTKSALMQAFFEHDIPAAPVLDARDLLADPLLRHREAFESVTRESGKAARSPRLAHRVAALGDAQEAKNPRGGPLPLSGLRVLDLGIITAGAGVSALLADLGAEVLKIESHTYPDPFRAWAGEAVSPFFKSNNRNKYGLALDLKTERDRARFLALVETADVVVENFRRGVLERLGIGYETLKSVNPSIMLASISGQGLDGPGAEASSFGSTLEASSGFSARVCYDDGAPYTTGRNVNYPDQTVVLYAAAVIAAAVSGGTRGMHLDVSQRDVTVYLLGEEIERVSAGERATDVAVTQSASVNKGSEMYALETASRTDAFATGPDGNLVKGFPFQFQQEPMRVRMNSPRVGEHTDQFCA